MVDLINQALGTDVEPKYVENLFEVNVHDTKADYSKFNDATGWEPAIDLGNGVSLVCEEYTKSERTEERLSS